MRKSIQEMVGMQFTICRHHHAGDYLNRCFDIDNSPSRCGRSLPGRRSSLPDCHCRGHPRKSEPRRHSHNPDRRGRIRRIGRQPRVILVSLSS